MAKRIVVGIESKRQQKKKYEKQWPSFNYVIQGQLACGKAGGHQKEQKRAFYEIKKLSKKVKKYIEKRETKEEVRQEEDG